MDIEKAIWLVAESKTECTLEKCKDCSLGETCKFHNQRADGFIELLEELQQYRQIGTVERFAALDEQMKQHVIDETCCPKRNCNKCDKYRKELEKYRQIGTLDECRATRDELIELQEYRKLGTVKECWEAREKQIAKTPDYEGDGYADGELVYDTWICPNCGEYYEVGYDNQDYCPKCGQHIQHEDWESD